MWKSRCQYIVWIHNRFCQAFLEQEKIIPMLNPNMCHPLFSKYHFI